MKKNALKLLIRLKCFTNAFMFFWALPFFIGDAWGEAIPEPSIDIYKTSQISIEDVKKKFGKKIKKIARLASAGRSNSDADNKMFGKLWMQVISGIHSMGDFSYVQLSPITYTEGKGTHITIDVVDKKDQHRISSFLPKPKGNVPDPDHLIEKWLEYEKVGFKAAFQGKTPFIMTRCPAHHCVYGFEHGELKQYENVFNTLVPKNKRKLIAILRKDKDENKRAAAAFLLAHLKNSKDVINAVSPSVFDSSARVRNGAMRVIGVTLFTNPSATFPIQTVLKTLDFPEETDRNKALMIMTALINNPASADYVKKYAAHPLIENLKMLQPNLHNTAYDILKKISGKNFGERDYKTWKQWADSVQGQTS